MVGFAKSKEEFLKTFLELPNGIPSEDTINRMFTSIDSIQLERMGKFYYRFKFWANNCD
jgi:hypothetical protein